MFSDFCAILGDPNTALGNIELGYACGTSAPAVTGDEQVYANIYWNGRMIYIHGRSG